MKCTYTYKGKIFNSEIELDDFLIEKRQFEPYYKDLVFSKTNSKMQTETIIRDRISPTVDKYRAKFEEAKRKAKYYEDDSTLEFTSPYIGVNRWLSTLKTPEGHQINAEFREKEYWENRFYNWTSPLQPNEVWYNDDKENPGRFTKSEIETWFPGNSFEEKLNNITKPLTQEEAKTLRKLMEKKWKRQALEGDAIHFIMLKYFSSDTFGDETVNIRDLKDTSLNGLPSLKQYLKEKFETEFKASKGRNWDPSLMEDKVLDEMIRFADALYAKIKRDLGEDLTFFPELEIVAENHMSGPNEPKMLMGIIDLLVVDKNGQVHIYDYKTSPKPFNEYNSAKKRAFYYQLATYGKMLRQYGLNYYQSKFGIIPIQLDDFRIANQDEAKVDPEKAQFEFNNIKYNSERLIEDITGEIFRSGREGKQTILSNLDDYLPEPIVVDVDSENAIQNVTTTMKEWFPNYDYTKQYTRDDVIELVRKNAKKNEDGSWIYKPKNSYAKEITAASDAELVEKLIKKFRGMEGTRHWQARVVAEALKYGIKNTTTDINDIIKSINTKHIFEDTQLVNWFSELLGKYCNEEWEVIEGKAGDFVLNYGMILVRNKLNKKQIDVIKMSTANLSYLNKFGSENRTGLTGAWQTDIEEKSKSNSQMLAAYNGNIELIEATLVLNNIPKLFEGEYGNAVVGNIQVVNSWSGDGMSASNEQLTYCLKQLNKYKEMLGPKNILDGTVKFATAFQLACNAFDSAMTENKHFTIKDKGKYEKAQSLLYETIDNSVESRIRALQIIIKNLELDENIRQIRKDDLSKPAVRLYYKCLIALASLQGINFNQQIEDHEKWLEDKTLGGILKNGVSGTYIDNPGNLSSDTLNLVTKLITQAYQNVRYDMQGPTAKLRKLTEDLKRAKNFGWVNKETTNQTSLYENMTKVDANGNFVFVHPDDVALPEEKAYLNYVLDLINKRRFGSRYTKELLDKMKRDRDLSYFLVPLMKAEFESESYGKNLTKSFKKRINVFNPKELLDESRKALLGIFVDEHVEKADSLFEVANQIDVANNKTLEEKQAEIKKRGINFFERNLEVIALKHEFAYSVKENIDKVMPTVKAGLASLAMLGEARNREFENDVEYMENYVKAKIKNLSLHQKEGAKETEASLSKVRQLASFMALSFSPVQGLYQTIQGLWNDISLIIRKPDGTQAFTLSNMIDAAKIVYKEMFHYSDTPTKCQLINELYGINDMDMNTYASKLRTDKAGIYNLWDVAFKFTSRPDFYNRMMIIVAKMKAEGVWDAYDVVDGKLVYNFKKDKRFSDYVKGSGPNYDYQRELYNVMARLLVIEGMKNPDGTPFEVGQELPTAYTNKEAESMKDLCDLIYGYYSHEKKSMIHSTWLGALYMQMRTYWSGKKNQYLAPGGVRLLGKWEHIKNLLGELLYYLVNPDGTPNYDAELTTTKTSAPVIQWKGLWLEGIILTLRNLIYDGNGLRNIKDGWNDVWNNEDENIRLRRRSNIKLFGVDLAILFFIGSILGGMLGDWDKEMQKDAKEVNTLEAASTATLLHIFNQSLHNSCLDFAWWSSIGDPLMQWSPFSFEYGTKFLGRWWNVIMGDKSFYDGITNSLSVGRLLDPLVDYFSPE